MTGIYRNIEEAENTCFDLVVVGGGIHGACLMLESARRGLKTLLIERDDFGAATSFNSLRVMHGGLRYLQQLDLRRVICSVREQAWWLSNFRDLVEPLPCLMPLYDRGLRRRSLMRAALALNNLISRTVRTRYQGLDASALLPGGSVISRAATIAAFDLVDQRALTGGAVWHDARMTSPPRLMMEILRWAATCGATALNYVACTGVVARDGRVAGVRALCRETNRELEFRATRVVNCAGPWNAEVAELDATAKWPGQPDLAIAYNVVLSRPPIAQHALAVSPPRQAGHTYFIVPLNEHTLAGTAYLPVRDGWPAERHVAAVLADLNLAIPGYELRVGDVNSVMVGRLPAERAASTRPARSPRVIHHRDHGGLAGLVSVIGVKYTTARSVAERALCEIFQRDGDHVPEYTATARPHAVGVPPLTELASNDKAGTALNEWLSRESVLHLDDLLLRRCGDIWAPDDLGPVAERVMEKLGWDEVRRAAELKRLHIASRSQKSPIVAV